MKRIELTDDEELLVLVHRWLAGVSPGIWPGWRAGDTPIAVYTPQRRVLLVAHPTPPEEFEAVSTNLGPAAVFEGNHPRIRGCTTQELGGIQTACLATDYPHPSEQVVASAVGLMVHEAFHCFQHAGGFAQLRPVSGVEGYPHADVTSAALCRVENRLMAEAAGKEPGERVRPVQDYLGVRLYRLHRLQPEVGRLESDIERLEGTAQYAAVKAVLSAGTSEFALTAELEPRYGTRLRAQSGPWYQAWLEFLRSLTMADPVHAWSRYYALGACKGLLLDQEALGWKQAVSGGSEVNAALAAAFGPANTAVSAVLEAHGFEAYRREAQEHQDAEKLRKEELLAAFDLKSRPVLVFDLAATGLVGTRQWDPVNLVALPGGRRAHTRTFCLRRPGFILDSHASPPVTVLEDPERATLCIPVPDGIGLVPGQVGVEYDRVGLRISCPEGVVTTVGAGWKVVVLR